MKERERGGRERGGEGGEEGERGGEGGGGGGSVNDYLGISQ